MIPDLPDDLKQRIRDSLVNLVARQAEKLPGGDKTSRVILQLSSQAVFYNAFDQAIKEGVKRFGSEYTTHDKELVEAISADGAFWQSKTVRQGIINLIRYPGTKFVGSKRAVVQQFVDALPDWIERERVNTAVTYLLNCIVEELWALPGISEIREIYNLQFQKLETEAAIRQVALLEAQLQATSQLGSDLRQALLQLTETLGQRLLLAPQQNAPSRNPYPYQNLPQPDYITFIGREGELAWLRHRLAPEDRAWQMVISGIGGVGKSALALASARFYLRNYHDLSQNERFDAIIWLSAKEEVLTAKGREKFALAGLILRTLEDIYSTIAQTLEREDITRAIPEEQDRLVRKHLSSQRTLLIVDNLESVMDEKVKIFLRNLPAPTKCIITSREWVDVADVLKLTGLHPEEAQKMISEEADARDVVLTPAQRQRLLERTASLPLPIKLSVARMAGGESFDQVMRWLGDATGDLPEYCVKSQIDSAKQRDLNAWKLLLACSLFDQETGASRAALAAVADLSLADHDDGLALLQRLSLLNSNQSKSDRFWMLPLVQSYAAAELSETDFREELTERWFNWYLDFTKQYGTDLNLHVERAHIIASEYPNLLVAIRWCKQERRWGVLLQLIEGIWFYPYLVGLFGEFREWLEAAVEASVALENEQRKAAYLRLLGLLYWQQDQYERAIDYLKKAEEIALKYQDTIELGRIGNIRTDILQRQGHPTEAEREAEAMLEIGERYNNLEIKALAAYRLAEFSAARQQFNKALEWLDQGDQWSKELGWLRGLVWNIYLRGEIQIRQKHTAEAETYLLESLELASSWGERHFIAPNKHLLAQVYFDTGRLQLARKMAEDARDLYERLGREKELAKVEDLLGQISAREAGNKDQL